MQISIPGVSARNFERGTWTPTVNFSGASVGLIYSSQAGYFQRTYNSVNINSYVGVSAKGSSAGQMRWTLPFVVMNQVGLYGEAMLGFSPFPGGYTTMAEFVPNFSEAYGYRTLVSSGSVSPLSNTDMAASFYVSLAFNYFTTP